MSRRDFARIAAALLGFTLLLNLVWLLYCGDGLSPMDPYSEAGVVRAGERFAREGFLENFGLPDVTYGDRFPGEGMTEPSGSRPSDPIYHGYPPGSEWLGGLYSRWLGPAGSPFPGLPGYIRVAGLGDLPGWPDAGRRAIEGLLGLPCLPPDADVHRDVARPALPGLRVEPAIDRVGDSDERPGFVRPRPARPGTMAALFLMGFLQGYLSYDYWFVTTFAAVPIARSSSLTTGRSLGKVSWSWVSPPVWGLSWRTGCTSPSRSSISETSVRPLRNTRSVRGKNTASVRCWRGVRRSRAS